MPYITIYEDIYSLAPKWHQTGTRRIRAEVKAKITKRTVDAVKPKAGDTWVQDTEIKGFGLRVRPTGSKEYFLRYHFDGERRYKAIGQHGSPWDPASARREAHRILGLVADRKDPRSEDRTDKTVGDLCDLYFTGVRSGKILLRNGKVKSDSTLATDEGRIERHIKPLIGKKVARKVSRTDIERVRDAITAGETAKEVKTGKHGKARVTGGAGTAARTLGLLGAIFAYGEREGLVDTNPVRGVTRQADKKNTRSLTEQDYKAIGKAIKAIRMEALKKEKEEPGSNTGRLIALDAIEVIFLTGCRRSEILSLKQHQVDQTGHCFRFEDTKTGPQVRPVGEAALKALKKLKWKSNEGYIFPATKGDGHNVGAPKIWNEIRDRAGVKGVTLHTARHGFASVANELNFTELTIAGLLGHASGSVTKRYIHFVDTALVAAADEVSREISKRMISGRIPARRPASGK